MSGALGISMQWGDWLQLLLQYLSLSLLSIGGAITTPEAASNLGTLYYFNGRFAEAEVAYRRSIQIAPRDRGWIRRG